MERPPSDHEDDASEDLEEGELQIVEEVQDSEAESRGGSPHRWTSGTPLSAASIQRDASVSSPEMEKTPLALSTPVEIVAPVDTGSYPAFPSIGEDAVPFQNAMFGVFQRAMVPPQRLLAPWVR